MVISSICFIVSHAGPAEHFAAFQEALVENNYEVKVFAADAAARKLSDLKSPIQKFEIGDESLDSLVEHCQSCSLVITDVGHPFSERIHCALRDRASHCQHFAYYDNPESFVPGGYSETAKKVMDASSGVLFANMNLVQDATFKSYPKRVGIGYYPLEKAENIACARREDLSNKRQRLFDQLGFADHGQRLLFYYGGNNEVYFNKAFPALLQFLEDGIDPETLIFLQQHPGAKKENSDGQLLAQTRRVSQQLKVSPLTTDESLVLADGALYYQTSMGPLYAIAGIPAMQVGHQTYSDILVQSGIAVSSTTKEQFHQGLSNLLQANLAATSSNNLKQRLGISKEWKENLCQWVSKEST